MKRTIFKLFPLAVWLMGALLWLSGCAKDDADSENGVKATNNANAAEPDDANVKSAANQGKSAEFSEKDDGSIGQGKGDTDAAAAAAAPDAGSGVNNAAEEKFATEAPTNAAKPGKMEDAAKPEAAEPAEAPTAEKTAQAGAKQSSNTQAPVAAAVPAAGGGAASQGPQPGGAVQYVSGGKVDVYSAPDGKSVVHSLEKGDHPLVYDNGEWARTSDGYYIQKSALTTAPVGRSKAPVQWH